MGVADMPWNINNAERRRQTDAAAAVTGTRWCQHGMHYAPAETVGRIQTKNGVRAICEACRMKRKQSNRS
jgi:hypothetical protein